MAEKEYIDRHALKNDGHLCYHDGKGNVYYEVDHAPAADVAEVRHGEWVDRYGGHCGYPVYICTACGHSATWGPKEAQILTNYCPNCGAKMDGKGEGDG